MSNTRLQSLENRTSTNHKHNYYKSKAYKLQMTSITTTNQKHINYKSQLINSQIIRTNMQ